MNDTTVMTDIAGNLSVDVQWALAEQEFAESEEPPKSAQLTQWANMAYAAVGSEQNEVTIRIVERDEIIGLNRDYRQQDKATNVLSFRFENQADIDLALLGDVVICHPVVVEEATKENKTVTNHYAHMVTHGVLHLCGYDHQEDEAAEQMERLEAKILSQSGIANPYH